MEGGCAGPVPASVPPALVELAVVLEAGLGLAGLGLLLLLTWGAEELEEVEGCEEEPSAVLEGKHNTPLSNCCEPLILLS